MSPGEAAWWIENIGKPMAKDVEGLKRTVWIMFGGGTGVGAILGMIVPALLKKMGVG